MFQMQPPKLILSAKSQPPQPPLNKLTALKHPTPTNHPTLTSQPPKRRSTTKFWVRPADVPRLTSAILRHLPLLVLGRREGALVEQIVEGGVAAQGDMSRFVNFYCCLCDV